MNVTTFKYMMMAAVLAVGFSQAATTDAPLKIEQRHYDFGMYMFHTLWAKEMLTDQYLKPLRDALAANDWGQLAARGQLMMTTCAQTFNPWNMLVDKLVKHPGENAELRVFCAGISMVALEMNATLFTGEIGLMTAVGKRDKEAAEGILGFMAAFNDATYKEMFSEEKIPQMAEYEAALKKEEERIMALEEAADRERLLKELAAIN